MNHTVHSKKAALYNTSYVTYHVIMN